MEVLLFWLASALAIVTALLALTRLNASHALIYLVVTLLSIAVIFFTLGATFAAALEIVIYAGAIVVLFLFVVMMLNVGKASVQREAQWLNPKMWYGPAALTAMLFVVLCLTIFDPESPSNIQAVPPKDVGISLFTGYVIAVELAGVLLLAALVGAYHLGRRYLEERRGVS